MSAPLQAFTESGLKASLAKKDKNSNSRSKSKSSFTTSNKSNPKRFTQPKQRGGKKTKETILFDDAKRNEFLTGFSKRKNARKEAAKKYAESKILEERKAARKEAKQARKEQAAENVRAERKHFAGSEDEGSEDGSGDEEDQDDLEGWEEPDANAPPPAPQSFETSSHLTTVTIQSFDPDEDVTEKLSQPTLTSSNPLKRKLSSTIDLLPPSSRRSMKKEKNEKERLKLEKEKQKELEKKSRKGTQSKKPNEKDIINLLEPEINTESLKPAPPSTSLSSKQIIPTTSSSKEGSNSTTLEGKRKEKAFRYETKLERAKQRAHNADQRAKRKEKRLQEVESMKGVKGFIPKGGKTKQGMRKKHGKAGSGSIGRKTGGSTKKK